MSNCAMEHALNLYLDEQEKPCGCDEDCDCYDSYVSDEVDRGEMEYDNRMEEYEREVA